MGVWLPNEPVPDYPGPIHNGRHLNTYRDEVDERLEGATNKDDALANLATIAIGSSTGT